MLWLGLDDTDAPTGGCTTWAMTEVVRIARAHGLAPIGAPRLVRLNPNVPWRTRGNAALGGRFGYGAGRAMQVGEIDGRPVWAYARGRAPGSAARRAFVADVWARLRAIAPGVRGTDPALVVAPRPLPADLYWAAVRRTVPVGATRARLGRLGVERHCRGARRGLIGAAAAIAWPAKWSSWELIAYRDPARWGSPRDVDAASVRAAQRREPSLFLCSDPRTRRLLVTPHTPCPILFGLRGRTARGPLAARRTVRAEPVDRWLLFRTNQGSGDHLVRRSFGTLRRYDSGIVAGDVVGTPRALRGGHIAVEVVDDEGTTSRCIAFEPTKTLPRVVAALRPGDRVTVWGSRGVRPALRLEGLRVDRLTPRLHRARPRCAPGHRAVRSLGRGRGYRCPTCRRRWPPEAGRLVRLPSPLRAEVEYHPTPSARRHLAPLGPEP